MTRQPPYPTNTRVYTWAGESAYIQSYRADMVKLHTDKWFFAQWHPVGTIRLAESEAHTVYAASPYHPNGPQPPEENDWSETDDIPY
jgi:hypothetical protein